MSSPRCKISDKIRAFMSGSGQSWRSIDDIAEAVAAVDRSSIARTLRNFIKRGELEQAHRESGSPRTPRLFVRYLAPLPKRKPRQVRTRVFKAAYVSGTFTSRDLARLSGVQIGYVCRVIRDLAKAGHIDQVGRKCGQTVNLTIWHINDRDKFRLEVMR